MDGYIAALHQTQEVFDTAASRSNPTFQMFLQAPLAKLMLAVLQMHELGKGFQAGWANLWLQLDCLSFEASHVEVEVVLFDMIHEY